MARAGSVMSLGGLGGGGGGGVGGGVGEGGGGSYGGPPDCVKASYEKLHLTPDELQHLTRYLSVCVCVCLMGS